MEYSVVRQINKIPSVLVIIVDILVMTSLEYLTCVLCNKHTMLKG